MTKFILIDHSLTGVGGHHFEYALHVCRAAERAGLEIWLATNRKFRDTDKLPEHWKVRPLYQHSTYTRHRLSGDVDREPSDGSRWLTRLVGDWWNDRRRTNRAVAFARDTATLFGDLALEPGDQVFVPTLSELDLLGLAQFLSHEPRTKRVDWHLQFHFPIFSGCEPDYADQDDRLKPLRAIYNQALLLAADHRLYFYTTTEPLAVQHNRLGAATFQTLPYPVNPILQTGRGQTDEKRPLRVAYLGDARHEKGYQHLPELIERLNRDFIETDRARFIVQSNIQFSLPARGDDLEVVESVAALRRRSSSKIAILDEPAETEEFCRQVLETDIGLLLYDRKPYFSRCSGLLVEMLTAGVPALVSAGCWMADQLADVTRDYHTSLRHNRQVLAKSRAAVGKRFQIPEGASDLLLFFLWPNELGDSAGAYVRLEVDLLSPDGRSLGTWPTIIGPGSKGRWSTALVRLPLQAAAVEMTWQNAYSRHAVEFRDAELCFIANDPRSELPTPRGAVGLIAADPAQAPDLLIDLIENHAHYRQTAAQFARGWTAWHNPDRVVAELLAQRRAIPMSTQAPARTPAPSRAAL